MLLFHFSTISLFHYSWLEDVNGWLGILYYWQFVEFPVHII